MRSVDAAGQAALRMYARLLFVLHVSTVACVTNRTPGSARFPYCFCTELMRLPEESSQDRGLTHLSHTSCCKSYS